MTNNHDGILLVNTSNCEVENNTITKNNNGILLKYLCNNNSIVNNLIRYNYQMGIGLYQSSNTTINNNIICRNSWHGVYLITSNKNKIYVNIINDTRNEINTYSNAISLSVSDANLICNNSVTNNSNGFNIYNSEKNLILNNTILKNGYGINNNGNEINTIYNNYFNNTYRNYYGIQFDNNVWNISITYGQNIVGGPYLGGNYWSNYAGSDVDGDGLGDLNIPFLPGDYHPLCLVVKDITPPNITKIDVTSPITGQEVIINAKITDFSSVDVVHILYSFEADDPKNKTMILVSGDSKNGTYSITLDVPIYATKFYFIISTRDIYQMWGSTPTNTVDVIDNIKPQGIDNTISIPINGELYHINITATDNIHVLNVFVEYWFSDNIHQNNTLILFNNFYIFSLNIPLDETDLWYKISIVDLSNNWFSLSVKSLEVSDQLKPNIKDLSDIPKTGDNYIFKFEISDNIELSSVTIEYWFDSGKHMNVTLPSNNQLEVSIPEDAFISYAIVTAIDSSNNIEQINLEREVIDNDAPKITDLTTDSPKTNESFIVKCGITENRLVKNVTIKYRFNDGLYSSTEMSQFNDKYELEIMVPQDAITIDYEIVSIDTGNSTDRIFNSIKVLDTISPIFTNIKVTDPSTGDEFWLTANVIENIEIQFVVFEYWFNENPHKKAVFEDHVMILVPSYARTMHYNLTATDISGNLQSLTQNLEVVDNDSPTIEVSPVKPTTGGIINLIANITDNIGIESSYLIYWFNQDEKTNVSYTGNFIINVPENAINFHYEIYVTDEYKNAAYIYNDLSVEDQTKPIILDKSKKIEDGYKFSIEVSDNTFVERVYVEYRFDSEPMQKLSLIVEGGLYEGEIVLPSGYNKLYYVIYVEDNAGNINTTDETGIDIKTDKGGSSSGVQSITLWITAIISPIIFIIVFLFITRKKKPKVDSKQPLEIKPTKDDITVPMHKQIQPLAYPPVSSQPQAPIVQRPTLQSPIVTQPGMASQQQMPIYTCEKCGAVKLHPDSCPKCGWIRYA